MFNLTQTLNNVRLILENIKTRIFSSLDVSPVSSILRNVLVLASGVILARIIGSLSIPLITRIYTPENLGVLSVFASLSSLMAPLGTLRYSAAIPLPKSTGTAINLLVLCFLLLLTVSTFIIFFLYFFASDLLLLISMPELIPYWWMLVLTVLGAGLYELLSAWATRVKAFDPLAKTKVSQSISSSITKIGLGLFGFKPSGLLIGHFVAQVGGCLSLLFRFYPHFRTKFKHVSKRRMIFVFKRYSDFFKFRLPSQFLLVFSINSPLLFAAILFGKETTGQLGLALNMLALPMSVFGSTMGQAYYAEIAKIGRKNPNLIREITLNVTKKLLCVSIPMFIVLLFAGPFLFEIIFGDNWYDAGIFARILSFYLIAQFVSSPIANTLNVFDKQSYYLFLNISRCTIVLLVFFISHINSLDHFETILLYSVSLAVHYTILWIIVMKTISTSRSEVL